MPNWEIVLAIAGLAVVTIVTRAFFMIPDRELPMPDWLREALRYAPLAALCAVVAPEILLTQGQLPSTWRDPRLFAAVAAALWFWWQRGILGTILCGTTVLLTLRLGLGW